MQENAEQDQDKLRTDKTTEDEDCEGHELN